MCDKTVDRRVVYCLLCLKPTETIATHLARVCMKANTPKSVSRDAESQRIYQDLDPRRPSLGLQRDLPMVSPRRIQVCSSPGAQEEGFLVQNHTEDSGTTKADDPSTSAAELPASPLASSSSAPENRPVDQPHSALESDPSWQRLADAAVHHQTESPHAAEKPVDNVSRVLRYIQPTGEDINLDFLDKTTVLGEYFEQLKKVASLQRPGSTTSRASSSSLVLETFPWATDLSIVQKCQHYQEFLQYGYFVGPKTSVHKLRAVLREAKNDTLGIFGRFLSGEDVTEEEKTRYRYYCEAILIFGHLQLPGAVTEWVQRQNINDVVVAVKSHKTANSQVAPFALTEEEAALINQYYLSIRSDHVWDDSDSCDSEKFFLAKNGKPINSATNDVRRLHEVYKCPNVTSQEIRRAAETERSNLTDEQKTGLAHYLALRTRNSDDSDADRSSQKRPHLVPEAENFCSFQKSFPVTLDGKPPNKLARRGAGFGEDRTFYDRWRGQQFKMRETHLLGK
ncbi:hypothetical protein WMY93_032884 [Mugilogobius chulae]|uniref:Uncharacterized protein n=1 Tax=Mugilogobius chulae TaxID=88201 RepID=A0AAW0MTJ2_9GOBI